MHGNAKMTGGRLMKKDLKYNKAGKIVSKKLSRIAKKEQRLQKAGYKTQKGVFELFQKQIGGDSDEEEEEDEDESKATVPPRAAPGAAPLAPIAPPGGSAAILKPQEALLNRFKNTFIKGINQYLYDILKTNFSDKEILEIAQILLYKYNNTPILAYQFIINKIRGEELNTNINNDYISYRVEVVPSSDYNTTEKIIDLFSDIKEGRLIELQLLRRQNAMAQPAVMAQPAAAMAPGGSAAAAIPNLNELITRASLLKESINIYSENQKTRAIDALAEDIKKLYFNDIDIDTIKTALVSHKYNIENVIVNLVTTKINTARQQFNLTKRQYTNQNKEKIINKIKANTPIGEIIGSYLDFST